MNTSYRLPAPSVNIDGQPISAPPTDPKPEPQQRPPKRGVRVGKVFVLGRSGTPLTGERASKPEMGGRMFRTQAWRDLKPGPVKVLSALWEAAGGPMQSGDGSVFLAARIGLEKLSERTGYSVRSVSRHISALRRAGLVEITSTGRSNCYNLIPLPDGEPHQDAKAGQEGQGLRARVDGVGAPDTPSLARPHITSRDHLQRSPSTTTTAPAERPHTNAGPLSPVGVVVVDLLMGRGVSEKTADSIARTRDLPSVVRAIAALDSGELRAVGGLVQALTNGWATMTKPKASPVAPTPQDVERARKWWNSTKSARGREWATSQLRSDPEAFGLSRSAIDGGAPSAIVAASRIVNSRTWWSGLDEPTKAAWLGVVHTLRPDLQEAAPDYAPSIMLACGIARGKVLMAERTHDAGGKARKLTRHERPEHGLADYNADWLTSPANQGHHQPTHTDDADPF